MKDLRQVGAVVLPMPARRVLLQAGDPVAVELVDGGVDAVALEPAVAERAAVAERGLGGPFGEPRLAAEQRLEHRHAVEMTIELRHGRPADVQPAVAVVVQLQREVRLAARGDLAFEPLLQRGVLRRELGIGGLVPVAIQVLAAQVEARPRRARRRPCSPSAARRRSTAAETASPRRRPSAAGRPVPGRPSCRRVPTDAPGRGGRRGRAPRDCRRGRSPVRAPPPSCRSA